MTQTDPSLKQYNNRCGIPTTDVVLRERSSMQPTCTGPDCNRPSPDAYLCTGCTRYLEKLLAELPAALADLQTTLTRQSRTTRGGGGKPTKAAEAPLPYDAHASNVSDRVRNGLSTWIRHLCETRDVPPPTIVRTQDMAIWLTRQVDTVRQDEAAAALLSDLKQLRYELRAAVDNREYRYAGPCTAVLQIGHVETDDSGDTIRLVPGRQEVCGADLRRREGAHTVVCHDCGAEYDAAERSAWIDKQSADQLATGPIIAKALADAGYRVKPALIRNWAERTRQWMHRAANRKDGDPPLTYEEHPIQQVACQVETRLPLYRVGDVYRRVKADPERRQIGA